MQNLLIFKKWVVSVFLLCPLLVFGRLPESPGRLPESPDQIYGPLFQRVQMGNIFPDQKTFVDAVPKREPVAIMADYNRLRNDPKFNLKSFVAENFTISEKNEDILSYIKQLWIVLRRNPTDPQPGSSLLPLPHSYIVPGGRFSEIYYWDSYFTMLGLRESGEVEMIENMVKNFASLIDRYGFVPNGNRSYYLGRSQQPYFSLMVELLADTKGDQVYVKFLPELLKEYDYWMDKTLDTKHVVQMPNGEKLNRYYDRLDTPRPESYLQDLETAKESKENKENLFRNIRSAAESGWDFSGRWCSDGYKLSAARTTDLIPVDLNCVLHHLETTLAKACKIRSDSQKNDLALAKEFESKAEQRKDAINKYCWSPSAHWYVDCDIRGKPSPELTLGGVAPLFFKIAPEDRVIDMMKVLKDKFIQPGGVVTTLKNTGQQWDAPNGWAPLQWLTIQGLRNYGQDALAKEIALRWLALNIKVFQKTGKLKEKYNVMDIDKLGGGGEYEEQDGFGWTNGVFLKLVSLYGIPQSAPLFK